MAHPPIQFLNKLLMLLFYMPLNHLPVLLANFLKNQGLHVLQVVPHGHVHHLRSHHYFLDFHLPPAVFAVFLKSDGLILKASDYLVV